MRVIRWILILALAISPAIAAERSPLDDTSIAGKGRYERCMTLLKISAERAEDAAEAWRNSGGGAAALHCSALALVALHRYAEAAVKLDETATAVGARSAELRITLSDQAGNAWLLAGEPQKAEASFNAALGFAPTDEDILFDRARARAARRNWPGAEADLTTLLLTDPSRADALVLRASARHAEGKKDDAQADIDRALRIYPNYPEALVERGAMRFEAGDQDGARADWNAVAHASPNSDAGAAARAHLAEMSASVPPR